MRLQAKRLLQHQLQQTKLNQKVPPELFSAIDYVYRMINVKDRTMLRFDLFILK